MFVNLTCFCIMFQYFGWNIFIFCPNFTDQPLKLQVLWWKTGIYSWNLSEKVSLMYEGSSSIPLLRNLKYISLYLIHDSMKNSGSSWSSSEPSMFFKIDPQYFGVLSKPQDAKELSMQTASVSRLSLLFL